MKHLFNRLIKPSTRSFIREAVETRGYSIYDFLHGHIYIRWVYFYIRVRTGESRWMRLLGRGIKKNRKPTYASLKKKLKKQKAVADTYHGKVLPIELAEELVFINHEIQLPNLLSNTIQNVRGGFLHAKHWLY